MIQKVKTYINKSEFVRNSLTMISGTTIAQILPIAISPVLTRIYTPDDFGVLALFMSLSVVFAIIAGGRYELAIILPKKNSYAINILALVFVFAGIVSFILMVAILLFHDFFISVLRNDEISIWLYLLPLVVFLLASFTGLNFYNTRHKEYKRLAVARVIRSSVLSVFQLGLFFLKNGVVALISGYSLSQIAGNMVLLKKIVKDKKLLNQIEKPKMIALAKKYKKFPLVTMIASLFNKSSTELPTILISSFFDISTLGFYSLGYRILSVPIAFIGMSVSQVFMQEAASQKQTLGNSIAIFDRVLKKLLLIGIPFFGFLFLTAKPIFGFVFGEEWEIAGTYAKILSPLLFFRFTVSTLSTVLFVFEKHTIILILQITLLLITIATFVYADYIKMDFESFLIMFSLILSAFYIVYLIILRFVANSKI